MSPIRADDSTSESEHNVKRNKAVRKELPAIAKLMEMGAIEYLSSHRYA